MRNPNMPTLSMSEINHASACVIGEYVTYWLSDDGETNMLVGYGPTELESEASASAEITHQELFNGSLVTFQVS